MNDLNTLVLTAPQAKALAHELDELDRAAVWLEQSPRDPTLAVRVRTAEVYIEIRSNGVVQER